MAKNLDITLVRTFVAVAENASRSAARIILRFCISSSQMVCG